MCYSSTPLTSTLGDGDDHDDDDGDDDAGNDDDDDDVLRVVSALGSLIENGHHSVSVHFSCYRKSQCYSFCNDTLQEFQEDF